MGIELDPNPSLKQYANPHKLVTNGWLGAKLGTPGLKVVESNEDSLLYDIGHIPTALRIHWSKDLSDPICRDFISAEDFATLMDDKGIDRDDTVVIYGDRANMWAMYTLWVFELFGHPDVRLLDGGRDAWMQEEREISYEVPTQTSSGYPVVERDDSSQRIFVEELHRDLSALQVIDLRSPEEYAGEAAPTSTGPGTTPVRQSFASRRGHIPGAINMSVDHTIYPNARFRSAEQLQAAMGGVKNNEDTVTYSEDGAYAAHQWFVLRHLLGWDRVRVYDGSWTEWGNMVRVPIAIGDQP